jgi:MHS family proline/betaine transporter-like MFS transporter
MECGMKNIKKQIMLCTAGTILEWYDFAIFANMTVLISQIFFSNLSKNSALFLTFSVFAIGYLARPFGAIFFGYFGDKISRKSTLISTILIMTASTTMIGMIPTGTTISIFLLVMFRLLQGFAASGEYGGGITVLYEQGTSKKGMVSSFGLSAAIMGIFLGASVVSFTTYIIGKGNMLEWGWRIPFLLGGPLGLFGYFIRRSLIEPPEFIAAKNKGVGVPVFEIFKGYKKNFLMLLMIYALGNICFYINFIYLSGEAATLNHVSEFSSYINGVITLGYAGSILLFAFLSDYINKFNLMICGALLLVLCSWPLFHLALFCGITAQVVSQLVFSLLLGVIVGPLASISADIFSANVRYSGIGLSLNLAASIFGGTTPLVCMWLSKMTNNPMTPAIYLVASAIICIIAINQLKKHNEFSVDYREIVNSV